MNQNSFNVEKNEGGGGIDNPTFDKSIVPSGKKEYSNCEEEGSDIDINNEDDMPWSEMSCSEKTKRVIWNTTKIVCVFTLLYFFVCSLDMLSAAFKLISGKSTSNLLGGEYMSNPIVGLMVGILLTVLLQSSSTSTSIIVSMVSAGMLNVHDTIPIIMGTNVGTSVTNTIVSLTQVGDREVFRKAFAGATVHDMFNWLAVIVMLTIEILFGFLEWLTGAIVDSVSQGSGGEVVILKVITDPLTKLIIQLDNKVLQCWGVGEWLEKDSLITEFCSYTHNDTVANLTEISTTDWPEYSSTDTTISVQNPDTDFCVEDPYLIGEPGSCTFLFYDTGLSDSQVGIILLVMSLVVLCGALIIIVKLLNSMLQGSIAIVIKKTLNADIPYIPWITGYIAILIGAVMTFIVQSSSIFTSTLTPLIGLGIITVERAYPLTLGSNIGTTTTALLASLAGEGEGLMDAVQVALVHLFFNVFGILIFYPIPFMRLPIPMCKFLGNITAEYRWFAIVYLVFMFFLMPVSVFMLSLGGPAVLWGVLGPILILLLFVVIVNIIQSKRKSLLPKVLQTWDFLPLPLRSLEPYDKAMTSLPCCRSCRIDETQPDLDEVVSSSSSDSSVVNEKKGHDNKGAVID